MEKNVLSLGLTLNERPATIDDLKNGHGTILYNHNIEEVQEESDGQAAKMVFRYDSLRVEYPITVNNITRTLLDARYPSDVQQKLLNDYQAATLDILDEDEADEAIDAYKAFLADRKAIKAMVKADCAANNIPNDL